MEAAQNIDLKLVQMPDFPVYACYNFSPELRTYTTTTAGCFTFENICILSPIIKWL